MTNTPAPVDDGGYGDGIDRSDAAIARRNEETRAYIAQQDAIATAEAREGYVTQETLDAALATNAKLSEALEHYYVQDVQLWALARSLRSLEKFNLDKARETKQPYRVHLGNAYGGNAVALERIVSKRSTDSDAPPTVVFADKLVKLIELWREWASPFNVEAFPRDRIMEYDALCKSTREVIGG